MNIVDPILFQCRLNPHGPAIRNIVASPHGLGEYLKFYESHSAFQCGFEHITTSGGLLSKELSEPVRARMCSNVTCSYGSTEAGTVAFGPAEVVASVPGAVGFITPSAEVEILGEAGQALSAGKEGVVRVRSPHLVSGYVGDPAQSAASFRDGWFHPGDIGYLSKSGLWSLPVASKRD